MPLSTDAVLVSVPAAALKFPDLRHSERYLHPLACEPLALLARGKHHEDDSNTFTSGVPGYEMAPRDDHRISAGRLIAETPSLQFAPP